MLAPGASLFCELQLHAAEHRLFHGSASFSDNTFNLSPLVALQTINISGNGGHQRPAGRRGCSQRGWADARRLAATAVTSAGLAMGTVSTATSSIVPSGSVIASNPAAGTQVNVGSAVRLLVSTGQAPPPSPNPLTLENNYFVTGDYASAGVTLRGTGRAAWPPEPSLSPAAPRIQA